MTQPAFISADYTLRPSEIAAPMPLHTDHRMCNAPSEYPPPAMRRQQFCPYNCRSDSL